MKQWLLLAISTKMSNSVAMSSSISVFAYRYMNPKTLCCYFLGLGHGLMCSVDVMKQDNKVLSSMASIFHEC
jgi:hypothetical protein